MQSSRHHLANMGRAWEEFARFKRIEHQVVRPVIASSWERSSFYGIDPYADSFKRVLTEAEFLARRESRRNLIRLALPFMRMLFDTCGKGFVIMLADEEGYIIDTCGKAEASDWGTEYKILGKGSNLGERAVGTNTVGTVLVEKMPMQVLAKEHYCRFFHEWTSSGAPIFGPSGDLIGVLNICGHYSKVHPHTVGMAIAAVKAIENQLQLEVVNDDLKRAHDFSKAVMESITEGLITVDQKGIITWINAAGGRIMGLEPAGSIGRPLRELGSALVPMQEALYSGGFSDQETVLENGRGRFHFIMTARPINNDHGEIIGAVSTLREIKAVRRLITNMVGAKARFSFDDLIGGSEIFQQVLLLARRAAASTSTILLQGESGTGKELFAQAIHNASRRAAGPFIAVNCAAIPRDLIESELFGYEEGAFTGARRGGCPGKFELAAGGTIFLDEIGDMPLDLQVTLLRFLQEKQVTRLGGGKVIPVDIRVIAATHRDLKAEIKKGQFRADLFYRLNIFSLHIPPLRERQHDILFLARYLVRKIGRQLGKNQMDISPEALSCLAGHSWPGNVRELENALERAINVASGDLILPEHLPGDLSPQRRGPAAESASAALCTLNEVERQAIINTLTVLKGNIAQAARVLGVSRNTLYNKIQQYEMKFRD